MANDFDIQGVEQLKALGARLKTADKPFRLKLGREIRKALEPTKSAVKASALASLPKEGGLNRVVAKSRIGISVRKTGSGAGVRLRASNPHQIGALDRGRLRHPVFGNREAWVTQEVKPGWFTKPTELAKPAAQAAVLKAMNDLAEELEG